MCMLSVHTLSLVWLHRDAGVPFTVLDEKKKINNHIFNQSADKTGRGGRGDRWTRENAA